MEKLHERILKYLKTLKIPSKIIYSSYHTAGEGEHKIFDHIRENKSENIKVIYGLDADLIFLSMASHRNNIYLIRENTELDNTKVSQFIYVNINVVVKCFNEQIYDRIIQCANEGGHDIPKETNLIDDIIFICYFLGNDFLPHIPTIDIKCEGLEMLLDAY